MLKLLALDRFTILLFVMVLLASFVPVSGQAAVWFGYFTTVAIAILFFLLGLNIYVCVHAQDINININYQEALNSVLKNADDLKNLRAKLSKVACCIGSYTV